MNAQGGVVGRGGAGLSLVASDMREILRQALAIVPERARILAVVPDKTRDDNTHELFPIAARILADRKIGQLDVIIAQGTHPPMAEAQKRAKIGAEGAPIPFLGSIFDHEWDRDESLVTLGTLASTQIRELTGGLLTDAIPVRANALLAPGRYDFVLVFGATTPHEVAGFAGGAKYFFPGIAGPELTHMTHWLGALASIESVIGRVETPVRSLIEAAAEMISAKVVSVNSVVTRDADGLHTRALFAGNIREAFRLAADISRQVHVRYTERRYRRVLAILDEHYDELWVGGKASYKLGGIVETGGELTIYAPHMKHISSTHGQLIEKYGYAPLEEVRDMLESAEDLRANLAVAAHLAHVSYAGARNQEGKFAPRYSITLATGVPADVCARVKLGYRDWRGLSRGEFEADPDALVVENAGRDLYLLEPAKAMREGAGRQ